MLTLMGLFVVLNTALTGFLLREVLNRQRLWDRMFDRVDAIARQVGDLWAEKRSLDEMEAFHREHPNASPAQAEAFRRGFRDYAGLN